MNVNKKKSIVIIILSIISISAFSQKKDVYFLMGKINQNYLALYNDNNLKQNEITLSSNVERVSIITKENFQKWKEKRKKNKEASILFNERFKALDFNVFSKNVKILDDEKLNSLRIVDIKWLEENSWKKGSKKPHDFKNIYFLHKIGKNKYISYKVGVTIIVH